MAAVSELITLGIGTPSTIPHLLTLGLFDASAIVYSHPSADARTLGRRQSLGTLGPATRYSLTPVVRTRTLTREG